MSTYGHLLPSDAGRAAATMGDIVMREDAPTGIVYSVDFSRWSQPSDSDTMYERSGPDSKAV